MDLVPPVIACPKSYNITLDPGTASLLIHFNTSTHPFEIIGGNRNRDVIFSPDKANMLPNSYINVTAIVSDASNTSVSCTFEVAALPSPCSEGGLATPDNGYTECRGGGKEKVICTVACNTGFVFVGGGPGEYNCDPKYGWTDTFVPDCVPEGERLFCRSVCLPFCVNVFLFMSFYVYFSACLSVCLSVRLPVCLFFCLSVCLIVTLSICLLIVFFRVCLSGHEFVCLNACLLVCLFLYLFMV